jgi:hypothetical protein
MSELPRLYVKAIQEKFFPDSYVTYYVRVGIFKVPENLEPFQWAKVPFIQTNSLERELKWKWAWVAHNGGEKVYGESCHLLSLVPPKELLDEDFDFPSSSENYAYV